jgi:hypothetical protein
MSEEQNIEQGQKAGKSERPEQTDSNILREQIILSDELSDQTSAIPKSAIKEMEVHHHPHVGKKNLKEYLLEGLMIFIAVMLGFFAESFRERLTNNEKEGAYMSSLLQDLKRDTAGITKTIAFQTLILKKMDSALQIPVEKLNDIGVQDSFYHHFVFFYSWISAFSRNDNTITQLKNAGGFNVIHKIAVIDSVNALDAYYNGMVVLNRNFYETRWQRLDEFAMQLIILPSPPVDINDPVYTVILYNKEMFTRYDRYLLQQLYSFIRFEKSDIEVNVFGEQEYREKAARLIDFINKEYHMENE